MPATPHKIWQALQQARGYYPSVAAADDWVWTISAPDCRGDGRGKVPFALHLVKPGRWLDLLAQL